MAHLQVLAQVIGPRPATSAAEAQAHAYAARCLVGWGAQVEVEPFRSARTFTWPWLAAALCLAGAAGLAAAGATAPWGAAAAALGTAGAFLFWALVSGAVEVGRLFPQGESRNVVARIPPQGPAARRVVLVAHADSTRSCLLWHPALVRGFGAGFALHTAAAAAAAAAAWGCALAPGWPLWRWLGGAALVPLAWGLLVLAHREVAGTWVQGANDNASGVAVALALARRWLDQPLARTEVWVAITGCEEVGAPVGARRLLARHRADLAGAAVIVLDTVGAGEVRYLTAEGMLPRRRAHPRLFALAQAVAQARPDLRAAPSQVPLGAYTDALPFLAAGVPCLAVWAERDGVLPNWHWPTDTLEQVDPAALDRAMAFVGALVERYDQETEPAPAPSKE